MGSLNTAIGAFTNWFQAPFKGTVSGYDLFLIVGLVVVFAFMWSRVINHIVE